MRSPAALSLKDAVRVISGKDDALVNLLDRLLGGALLATSMATTSPVPITLLEPKNELIGAVRERASALTASLRGSTIAERTRTIHAAHAILVVVSFVDALDETLGDLAPRVALTRDDVMAAATGERGPSGSTKRTVLTALAAADIPTPSPHLPFEALLRDLDTHYGRMASQLAHFITGLAIWDELDATQRETVTQLLETTLPAEAVRIYERDFIKLSAEAPEFAIWSNLQEHRASRRRMEEQSGDLAAGIGRVDEAIGTGLSEVRDLLEELTRSVTRSSSRWLYALSRAYEHELRRPLVATDDEDLAGITSPSMLEGYVDHHFRVAEYDGPQCRPESEYWWKDREVRDDLGTFLSAYLTSPRASTVPLLLLGHPGAGKSTLSRILVGQLPSAGFLPIRVTLREVAANASVRGQIDEALYRILGEKVSWVELVDSASTAMPIVILDGFDELVQATGVSRSDYLEQVQEFQDLERSQGRAVAVIVTSRTAVADRARVPRGSLVLKLEPFSEQQVNRWIEVWNASNAEIFASRGVQPLSPDSVLEHRDLSCQPILLLMLAVYDAAENTLQREVQELPEAELYERLLMVFVRREVMKDNAGLEGYLFDQRVARELDNLSVVALAMFNRDRQVIRERELDHDFSAVGESASGHSGDGFHQSLSPAKRILGRFFFVNKSEAIEAMARDAGAGSGAETLGRSFEFLHATFGEYLVARLLLQLVGRAHTKNPADPWASPEQAIDDGLLSRLYCYQAITKRKQVVTFVREILDGLSGRERSELRETLNSLLLRTELPSGGERYTAYAPVRIDQSAKTANYTATLAVLLVAAGGPVPISQTREAPSFSFEWWRSQTLLWQSRLDHEAWRGLVETLYVRNDGSEIIEIALRPDESLEMEDLARSSAARYRDGHGQSGNSLEFVTIHGEVARALDAAYLSFDGTASRSLMVVRDLDKAFGGVASLIAWDLPLGNFELLLDGFPGRSHYLAQNLIRFAFPDMMSSSNEVIEHLRFIISTVLSPTPPSRGREAEMLAWQLVRTARMCPPSVDLPTDLCESVLQAAVLVGPREANIEYYGECIRAGAEWIARGADQSGNIRHHVVEAMARLDLLHLVEGGETRVDVLRLVLDLERAGCGVATVAPELGGLDQWLDRFELLDVVSEAPVVVRQVLELATRRRLFEWASSRALPIAEALQAQGVHVRPVDVLFAVKAAVVAGQLEESEVLQVLQRLLPGSLLRENGRALRESDFETWEDATLAADLARYLVSQ